MTRSISIPFIIVFLSLLSNRIALAQINLSTYTVGVYAYDTIYQYYGNLPNSGIGYIALSPALDSAWVDGLSFVVVIDSVAYPNAVFADSQGTAIAVQAGDMFELPLQLQTFNGNLGFHVAVTGTPLTVNQAYFCDLSTVFTLGNDWGMNITLNSSTNCTVQPLQTMSTIETHTRLVYPNPADDKLLIDLKGMVHSCQIYNMQGQLTMHKSAQKLIDISILKQGWYLMKVSADKQYVQKFYKR